ncbi:hypothetical protein C1H46_023068 [Malus baccata]|uniref:30S ribosomal protein S13 n=1 Tax=Malus baccata TaxID=106549 RepID=A0A540LXV6_MALBA|nr:hypothetical protein C1H46_023068 [Malus baccata]
MQNKSWWDVRNWLAGTIHPVDKPLTLHNYLPKRSQNPATMGKIIFHGVRAQCLNIGAGMEIPDKKLLKYALQYIRGIGRARAGLIISELNMTNKLAEDLTRREVAAIGEEISNYLVGRELV